MKTQPIIETERLILKPFIIDDAEGVQELAGNYNVAKPTTNIPHPYKDGMAEEWIMTHSPAWEEKSSITYAIFSKISNSLIGAIGLVGVKGTKGGMGYWIGEPYWNQGYCTEAAKAFLDFCFNTMKLKIVEAEHLVSNPASGKVMEKAGMVYRESKYIEDRDGMKAEINIYEKLADERIMSRAILKAQDN